MRDFQHAVANWAAKVFGINKATNIQIRNYRFIEEALELVQSLGMTKEQVIDQVNYVYNREIGEPSQEVGGTMVALGILCSANGINLDTSANKELIRIKDEKVIRRIIMKEVNKLTPTSSNNISNRSKLVINNIDPSTGKPLHSIIVNDDYDHKPPY